MHKRRKTYAVVLLSTVLLSQSITYGAYAASAGAAKSTTAAEFTLDKLGSIALKSNVSVKLIDMDILAQPSGNILIYTLSYSNGSGSSVNLIDYFSKVTTKGGTVVQGRPITSDVTKKTVPSKSSESITYYVNISKATKADGANVSIFGWDFSSAGYQKKMGVFKIPDNYSFVVPKDQSQKITMNNLPVTTKAESLQMIKLNGKVYMKVGVSLANSGTTVLSDPGYKAYLKSAGGSVFELKLDDASSSYKVQPQEKKTIYYLVEVPSNIKSANMTLQFTQEDSTLKINLPVKSFRLPAATSDLAVAKDQSKKITMNNLPVTTKAESLQMIKLNGKVYMKVGVSLANSGATVLSDPGYKAYLKSAGGSVFELKLDDASNSYKVQPQEKKTIYYLVEVPSNIKSANMTLQFTQEDSTLKINLPVKSFKLPAATTSKAVANYAVEKISIDDNTVETQLKSASVYSENDSGKWSLQFRIKNLGKKSVTLSAYELSIKSTEGHNIPVDSKALANLTLKPLDEKIIDLSADVPLNLNQNTLQLQLTESAVADKIIFPTAHYKIPYSQESNSGLGVENMLENRHGTFGVKIDSIQRLPWADEDQIVAQISIRNTKSTTVKLPALKALVKAGLSELSSTTQIVAKNAQTSLAPNETAEMYVLAKVPYSFNFSHLRIEMQETIGENDVRKFLSLNTDSLNNTIHNVDAGGYFHIDTPGKKAEIRERRSTVYNGSSSNIMYTELEMNSKEPRKSEQAQLVAYYKTPENEYYEAEVSQSSKATSPNGKNVVTVWSKLPLNVNTSQLVLHIGEGVADGKLTAIGGKSTGYINTVRLSLNTAGVTPQSNLRSVELFPYSLSLTNVVGTVREGEDTLDTVVTYNLSKNEAYESGEYEHKLVLEIIDPNGQSMEKTLTLGTDLLIGNNKSYATTFKSNLYKKLRGGGIRMNLYDEFQGQRMLLGSQSYSLTYEALPTTSTDGTGSEGS
ncbi:hypothetical protein [Paenibacillus xylanivorans]|uniref:DUF4352 domain-containing protein n=1 Tax=Paenibacillus xylanivorans TaxID=1705561 RepID=A0A0N0C451_9BACL|nr:hypothetical protein [Paenibacillus xylanivorans]KOY15294.1 hypothetical protein AMS66_17355 [Paenibacillus xylanivorans]